ncbi:MAG TPA: hypothetical protein VNB94_11435 [Mycobacteriales bacterium]|nr:hypothetical protein [Mycobacteriales bacterium]
MRRTLAPLAALAALALITPASAGSFSYADPKDQPANGGFDILSVSYSTLGKGTGKRYVPATLVASMTLSAAPVKQAGVGYIVAAQVEGCGDVTFSYTPGTVASGILGEALLFVGCGGATDPTGSDSQILTPKFAITGSTLTWSMALKALPKAVRAGAVLTEMESIVDVVEPAFGTRPIGVGPGLLDTATTEQTWRIS